MTNEKEYVYLGCVFDDVFGMQYNYITDDDTIEEHDRVLVPTGRRNEPKVALVTSKAICTELTAPYPVSQTKKVLRKLLPEEYEVDYIENSCYEDYDFIDETDDFD